MSSETKRWASVALVPVPGSEVTEEIDGLLVGSDSIALFVSPIDRISRQETGGVVFQIPWSSVRRVLVVEGPDWDAFVIAERALQGR